LKDPDPTWNLYHLVRKTHTYGLDSYEGSELVKRQSVLLLAFNF
jgi:hypothetical protein